jgi:hypothetical protein
MSPVKYELGFYISGDGILHSHRRGNLKSYKRLIASVVLNSLTLVTVDGSDTFLRNVGSNKSGMASHLRKRHSSNGF